MKQAKRARGYHHGDLKNALIAAAREMLERDGPEAISIRAIARAAGVSQTAPYNHFGSKDDLLATIAEGGFRELEVSQTAAAAARPGEARVVALGVDYVRFAFAHPQLYRLMHGVGVSDWSAHPAVTKAKASCFHPIKNALTEHLAAREEMSAEVETAAITAWALAHGLSMLLLDRSLDPAKKATKADALVARVMTFFATRLKRKASTKR